MRNGQAISTATAGRNMTLTATGKQGGRTVSATKSVSYAVKGEPASCSSGYVALTYDDRPTSMTSQYVTAPGASTPKATFF